ncbi:MAG: hypothetical protein LBR80_16265 [Deltaproteobacteria bacterium]|jgi:hypothetical protein|nr:hypothetical protein [Deltaproteobacteria bacterium]
MTVTLKQDGFWPTLRRFLGRTGVLVFVDAVLSLLALFAALLLLTVLAKADSGSYRGTFQFDPESGYPEEAPAFGGSYDPADFLTSWTGEGDSPARQIMQMGSVPTDAIFTDSVTFSGASTLITASIGQVKPGGAIAVSDDGSSRTSEGNILVIASPGDERIVGGVSGAGSFVEINGASYEARSSGTARNSLAVADGVDYPEMGTGIHGGFVNMHGGGFADASGNVAVLRDVRQADAQIINNCVTGGSVRFSFLQSDVQTIDLTGEGTANSNLLWIEDSRVSMAYGGFVYFTLFSRSPAGQKLEASRNRVVAIDTAVMGNLYGGYVANGSRDSGLAAAYNSVTVVGDTHVGMNLRGGYVQSESPVTRDQIRGNVLNVVTPAEGGITVGQYLSHFETMNFVFGADAPSGSVGLKVGRAAVLYDAGLGTVPVMGPDGSGPRLTRIGSIDFVPGLDGKAPEVGAEFVLIESNPEDFVFGQNGILTPPAAEGAPPAEGGPAEAGGGEGASLPAGSGFTQSSVTGMVGEALELTLDLAATATRLTATVSSVKVADSVQAAASAAQGTLAFVGQGLDLLSDSIIDLIASEGQRADSSRGYGPACPKPGVTFSAGTSGWRQGGKFTSSGYSGLFSLSCSREAWGGTASAGAFLEGGKGHYRYSLRPEGADPVSLGGDMSYQAAGLFARYDFPEFSTGHIYLQGAFLSGKSETEFEDRLFRPGTRYEMSRGFTGGSLAAGFIGWAGLEDTVDISFKYLALRMRGGAYVTSAGDRVDFEVGRSSRFRAGATWSHVISPRAGMHLGFAADWENDGRSRAFTYGREIPSGSLKGLTGRLEAGVNFRPRIGSPISVSVTGAGFTGVKRGVSGSVNVGYSF